MPLSTPVPLANAAPNPAAALARRQNLPTTRETEGLAALPFHLREGAFFSARVADERKLSALRKGIETALSQPPGEAFQSRDRFIADTRNTLGFGHLPGQASGDSSDIADLAATRRLGLMDDFQVESAYEQARMLAGSDPDILDEFPAQELFRLEYREAPRNWGPRWSEAGGKLYEGRMIAPKDSPVWVKISRFGRPFPPFDFGSGMGIRDIGREEAERLGVITPTTKVRAPASGYESQLEFSRRDLDSDSLAALQEEFPTADIGKKQITYKPAPVKNAADLGLPSAKESWTFSPAPPRLNEQEGTAELERGTQAADPLGHTVYFDDAALDHWRTKGEANLKERQRFLPAALEAIKAPDEVWKSPLVTNYLKGFTEGDKQRAILVSVTNDGRVRTWFEMDIKKIEIRRKGENLLFRHRDSVTRAAT